MFEHFLRPTRREFLLIGAIIVVLGAFGRFLAGNGGTWTWLSLYASTALFGLIASRWPALNQLDVPFGKWLRDALGLIASWSLLLGAALTAVAVWMQVRSPYYMLYDWLLVTGGSRDYTDTNGEPYIVDDAGMSLATVLWTFAIIALLVFTASLLGAAMGANRDSWGANGAIVSSAIIGVLVYNAAPSLARANFDSYPGADSYYLFGLDGPQKFLLIAITVVIPLIVAGIALYRASQRRS